MSNIGIMEGAYFVGRIELLNWLNQLLQLDYTKVEQTCSAAAYCQIMDALYPGQVPLNKVNFNAKHEYEYVKNFKILQTIFDKLGIDKHIDVPKLVKGKYQDNLEFLQWIKRYYDLHATNQEYNALERRKYAYENDKKYINNNSNNTVKSSISTTKTNTSIKNKNVSSKNKNNNNKDSPKIKITNNSIKNSPNSGSSVNNEENQKTQELLQTITDLKLTIDGLEKERDFYFNKLREIEIICQNNDQQNEIIKNILKILYATDETEEANNEQEVNEEQEEQKQQEQDDLEAF